jgi:glycosyltransferase involved in cell wall biosynthesis
LKPAEIILVEDASGDDTLEALREIERSHMGQVVVVALDKNHGAASARNSGWAIATQPYVAFLDSDDAWHPRKIEIQYSYMKDHPEVVLCGHGHKVVRHEAVPDWEIGRSEPELIGKWALMLSNRFITPSVMVRRDIDQRFVLGQRHMEDHMLWLEIVCRGGVAIRLTSELAAIYKSPYGADGLSAQLWAMELGELKNYQRLHVSGYINLTQLLGLYVFSLAKFARRLVAYWGFLRWKR